jgi:putative redox protein
MVEIHIDYEGQLRCRSVHGPSGTEVCSDAPVDNHGRGESFSPTDLVTTAFGSCLATIMGIVAEQNGIDLKGTKIAVKKIMSSDMPRRIVGLPTEIFVPLPADHPRRQEIESKALQCPVHQSLHPDIDRPVTFHWEG